MFGTSPGVCATIMILVRWLAFKPVIALGSCGTVWLCGPVESSVFYRLVVTASCPVIIPVCILSIICRAIITAGIFSGITLVAISNVIMIVVICPPPISEPVTLVPFPVKIIPQVWAETYDLKPAGASPVVVSVLSG